MGMGMPIPIVNPHKITKFLEAYRPIFSKPQYAHFERYVLGLIASEKGGSNIQGINDLYVDRCDQSSLNRFLTQSPWDVEEMNKTRLRVLQHNRRTRSRRNGYLVLDDVLISKTGRCMSGVGFIFSKSEGRSVLGHNFVSTHYSDERKQYPVDLRMYIKEELAEPTGVEFRTKIELAIYLVNSAVDNGVSASIVVFDTWYFAKGLIDAIRERGMDWVTRAKMNRKVVHRDEKIGLRELIKRISSDEYERIEEIEIERDERYQYANALDLPMSNLGVVRLVLLKKDISDDGAMVLVSNRLDWSVRKIVAAYRQRWKIETFYRDGKQHIGLGEYQMRSLQGIVKHLFLVFVSYSLLECVRSSSLTQWIREKLETVGDICRKVKEFLLEEFIRWIIRGFQELGSVDKVIQLALR